MYDLSTSINNQTSQQAVNVLDKYKKALEKEFLSGLAVVINKMNHLLGHQVYKLNERVIKKTIDDVTYFCYLKDFGTEEAAIDAGFTIEPLMVKDSSITAPSKKYKYELHVSSKRLIVTIKDGEVIVTEDEESEAQPGVMHQVLVYQDEDTIKVETCIVKAEKAA